MIRATTPTQKFILHTESVKELLITYKQNDEIKLQKHLEDVTLENGVASFVMTQSETQLFGKGLCNVDCRILTNDDVALASQIFTMSVRDVLDSQILGDDNRPTTECGCVYDCHYDGCDCCNVEYEELIKGDKGEKGEKGDTGNGIESTTLNDDYTLTIRFTDGTSYTTPSIRGMRGEKGETGERGADGYTPIKGIDYFDGKDGKDGLNGVGIASTRLNADYTLTITLTDGSTYTTPSIRGERGERGLKGDKGDSYELTQADRTEIANIATRDIIDDESQATNKTWSANNIARRLSEIEAMKEPNVTIVGEPTIQNGQISDFTVDDYCQFPFIVDFENHPFTINLETTTGNEVNNQHNILDSEFGLAFAVRNSRFVVAISTNGTSWDMGEGIGSHVIQPNSTYRVRMAWDLTNFRLSYSVDGGQTYIDDIVKPLTVRPYPKQMFIGITSNKSTVYNGSINLNYCSLYIGNVLRWVGMGTSGVGEKADITLANINELGERKIKDVAETDEIKTVIGGDPASENAGLELIKQLKEHANKLGGLVDILAELPSDEIGIRIVDALHTSVKLLQEIANIGE